MSQLNAKICLDDKSDVLHLYETMNRTWAREGRCRPSLAARWAGRSTHSCAGRRRAELELPRPARWWSSPDLQRRWGGENGQGREGEVEGKGAGGRRRSKRGSRPSSTCAAARFGCGGLQARSDVRWGKETAPAALNIQGCRGQRLVIRKGSREALTGPVNIQPKYTDRMPRTSKRFKLGYSGCECPNV
jgi:hypothetical protein